MELTVTIETAFLAKKMYTLEYVRLAILRIYRDRIKGLLG